MTKAFRYLSRQALDRLDSGLQRLAAGDHGVSRSLLAREARDCLACTLPLHQFIERHDRAIGTVGFAAFALVLGCAFVLMNALTTQAMATAFASGMTAAVGGSVLLATSVLTNRAESAVTLAHDVLDELAR